MYIVASHITSSYSGTWFTDFVRSRTWEPLNMSSSTYSLTEALQTGRLTHAWATNARRIPNVFEQPGASFVAPGAGGVMSTVEDLINSIDSPAHHLALTGSITPGSVDWYPVECGYRPHHQYNSVASFHLRSHDVWIHPG